MANSIPLGTCACTPHLVPKPSTSKYRFTVYCRPVILSTIRNQFLTPNLEQELTKTSKWKYFSVMNLSHSYWILPLHNDSQKCQSFFEPDCIYFLAHVLHGSANAVLHLGSTLTSLLPDDFRQIILWWLAVFLIRCQSADDHVSLFDVFRFLCEL